MSDKITPRHLERAAYVYVRQSTTHQLLHNKESRIVQYGLQTRANELGFKKVVVIDDDLGISAGGAAERPGFGRLLAALCDGEIGAVFAAEASRLARNNREWHHLVDVCALTGALVIDHDGVYDPRVLNDRLILGLKGTMSEFELGLLRQRSQEALRQMIARGEVIFEVPVGYVRTADNRCEKNPDLQVQDAIRVVFRKFLEMGSVRQVLLWYRKEQVLLPAIVRGTSGITLKWRLPIYNTILKYVKNPIYAGAYVYGRHETKTVMVDGRARKTSGHLAPQERWRVLIRDHHPGYITWDQYQDNVKRLSENSAMGGSMTPGAAKRGSALLAGLLRCARCGRKFHVAYGPRKNQRYHCRGAAINHGTDPCIGFGGLKVDNAISEVFLEAVRPAGVSAAVMAWEQVSSEVDEKQRSLQLALEKARYEANRIQRQFDAVEPENRLVAAELERRWNEAMTKVAEIEERLVEHRSARQPITEKTRTQLMELGSNLAMVWHDPGAPIELKKRLLRTVIKEIVCDLIDSPPEIVARIHWDGGVHSVVRIPRTLKGQHGRRTDRKAVDLIRELAQVCPDKAIASILNRLKLRTGTGRTWGQAQVASHRSTHGIGRFDPTQQRPWVTMQEAAGLLGVSARSVRKLIAEKHLPASQIVTHAPWMIQRKDIDAATIQSSARRIRDGKRAPRAERQQADLPFLAEDGEV